ncbi:YegP family protein [Pseudarthrobacter sp. S9]|uniref:YegP family protein n=1 Tax=Pseudarthrobacter sp. S9 TaxID=3418421 RepID=UPI003D0070C3
MAGHFEIFTDAESNVRFRLLAADGTVLAISRAFKDKRSAADGIMAVRECAGTGLIREVRTAS